MKAIVKWFIGLFLIICFLVIHELGHLFGALLMGGNCEGVVFLPYGIGLRISCPTGICVFITAISGPILSSIVAVIVFIIGFKRLRAEIYIPGGSILSGEIAFFGFGADGNIVINLFKFDPFIFLLSFFIVGLALYIFLIYI